jgi:hypothetical protein
LNSDVQCVWHHHGTILTPQDDDDNDDVIPWGIVDGSTIRLLDGRNGGCYADLQGITGGIRIQPLMAICGPQEQEQPQT